MRCSSMFCHFTGARLVQIRRSQQGSCRQTIALEYFNQFSHNKNRPYEKTFLNLPCLFCHLNKQQNQDIVRVMNKWQHYCLFHLADGMLYSMALCQLWAKCRLPYFLWCYFMFFFFFFLVIIIQVAKMQMLRCHQTYQLAVLWCD